MALSPNIPTASDMLAKTQLYSDMTIQQDDRTAQEHGRVFNAITQAARRSESNVTFQTNQENYDWAGLVNLLVRYGYHCDLNAAESTLAIAWRE